MIKGNLIIYEQSFIHLEKRQEKNWGIDGNFVFRLSQNRKGEH